MKTSPPFYNLPFLGMTWVVVMIGCTGTENVDDSYQARRTAFQTNLTSHYLSSPDVPDTLPDLRLVFGDDLPGTLESVTYPGPRSALQAWVFIPAGASETPAPALLFLHAGSELYPDQQIDLLPMLNAGLVVMWPTYRGEHGNPGYSERMFGEVDDAAAAARWLATHPAVDGNRVYALGWSSGGGISSLLSLWDDVPLRLTASSGGLYGNVHLRLWSRSPRSDGSPGLPFDTTRTDEFAMRMLPGNFRWMKRPHYAYIETQNDRFIPSVAAAREANLQGDTLIRVIMVPGDHFSIFPEVVRRYLRVIKEESTE